ncbi:MAG: OmpA family protein [Lysobacterales bacterium]
MSGLLDWPRYSRWTWIVAIVLFLSLVLSWFVGRGPDRAAVCCMRGSATTAPSPAAAVPQAEPAPVAAPAVKTPAALSFALEGGKLVLEGAVPDQATKDRLLKAALETYGDGNVIDRLTVDASTTISPCAGKVEGLLAALKAGSAIGVVCKGSHATLTGTVPSEVDRSAREQWARDFFGADMQIVDNIEIVASPAPVTRAEDVRCGDRIPAAVTFATGSARIDAAGRKLLDAIAACLKAGEYEIAGYTDNVGSAAANGSLSSTRAEAVRTYLIGKGVAGERLAAVGHGADRPIADNATARGRAKNRRIEFTRK